MRLSQTKESKFFSCLDMPGSTDVIEGTMDLTIKTVGLGTYTSGETSYEMSFYESPKPLGLNVTNRQALMDIFGDVEFETASFTGHRVTLFKVWTQNREGKAVMGIRLRPCETAIQNASQEARQRINAAQIHAQAPAQPVSQHPQVPSSQPQSQPPAGPQGYVPPMPQGVPGPVENAFAQEPLPVPHDDDIPF